MSIYPNDGLDEELLRGMVKVRDERIAALQADLDEMAKDRDLWHKRESIAQEASSMLQAEVERLRELSGVVYQMLGTWTEHIPGLEPWLDTLSAAGNAASFEMKHLLPYNCPDQTTNHAPGCGCVFCLRDSLREQLEKMRAAGLQWEAELRSDNASLREQLRRMQEPVNASEGNALDLAVSPSVHIPLPVTMKALDAFVAVRAARAKDVINTVASFQSSTARAYWGRNQEAGKGNDAKKG